MLQVVSHKFTKKCMYKTQRALPRLYTGLFDATAMTKSMSESTLLTNNVMRSMSPTNVPTLATMSLKFGIYRLFRSSFTPRSSPRIANCVG